MCDSHYESAFDYAVAEAIVTALSSLTPHTEDSARLDWIIENIEYPKGLSLDHLMSKASYAESFRAAIDAALSSQREDGR